MNLKAPNGNPSNLNPTQYHLVRTDAFKAWFGDWEKLAMAKLKDSAMDEVTLANLSKDVSKVVDENGEPLLVYHGTKHQFNIFRDKDVERNTMGNSVGMYFTSSELGASRMNEEGRYIKVFLNIKNLVKIKKFTNDDFWFELLGSDLKKARGLPDRAESYWFLKNGSGYRGSETDNVGDVVKDLSIKKGIDGYLFPERMFNDLPEIDVYVCFYSNQIKLADGTNTTFDDSNNDIRFNNGGNVANDTVDKKYFLLIEYFQDKGYNVTQGANSKTTFGHSRYFYVNYDQRSNDNFGNGLKCRVSDHGVTNTSRIFDEFHFVQSEEITPFDKIQINRLAHLLKPEQFEVKTVVDYYYKTYEVGGNEVKPTDVIIENLGKSKRGFDKFKISRKHKFEQKILVDKNTGAKLQFEKGGSVKSVSKGTITIGASHEEGGIPVYNRGTNEMLEVEGGEGIINKRSMALNKEVTFNGEKMTPCEVASEINQMGGGVTYKCDNVGLSKEKYDDGGEFSQGRKMKRDVKKINYDIEDDDERITISIKGIGEVILTETYPKYEFLEDIGEDSLEELGLEEDEMIGKIEHIEIEDKYKGKGYAKLLMNKAIDVAKKKGLMPIYLNASPMGYKGLNIDDLTAFYQSFGFQVFLRQGNNNLMILTSDSVNSTKEKYDDGGEFEQQLDKDDEYYSNLRGVIIDSQQPQTIKDRLRMIEPYRKKFECGCETKKYNGGGQAKDLSDVELPKISDDYDILGEKGLYEQRPKIELSERDKVKAEKLGSAIKIMQDLLNVDYKPIIMADQENKKLHRYVEKYKHLNLYKLGWRANVGRSKSWAGVCYGNDINKVKKLISISYDFIVGDDAFAENLADVMLHEISHAIVDELFILNDFDLPLEKLKPSRIKDLSLYKQRIDIIDQTHSKSGGHGIMWAAVCESISKGFICDVFYRLAEKNELMLDYMYKCIRCDHEEFGRTPNFAQKCSKCQTPVLIIKNK
jgi:GNAT superfamily N-acetyltransferase